MEINFSEETLSGLNQLVAEDIQEYVENIINRELKRDGYIESDEVWGVRPENLIYPPSLTSPHYQVVLHPLVNPDGSAVVHFAGGGGGYYGGGGGIPDNLRTVAFGRGSASDPPLDSATLQILRSLVSHTKQTLEEAIDELERRKSASPDISDLDIAGEMYGDCLIEHKGDI